MYNNLLRKIIFWSVLFVCICNHAHAQTDMPFFKDAIKNNRILFYKKMVRGIYKNVDKPLSYSSEEDWVHAFSAINLIKYNTTVVNNQLDTATKYANQHSKAFNIALLELIHADYPTKYTAQIKAVFVETDEPIIMAMAANYILNAASADDVKMLLNKTKLYAALYPTNAILQELLQQLNSIVNPIPTPSIKPFFNKNYLPGQMIVYSFQRKDRNYPGLAMVRKPDGGFVKINDTTYFTVGQLARSASNMPSYISNGNTPQGIFKINGFDKSKSYFIGPTTNVQLVMPIENTGVFFGNASIDDETALLKYTALLPSAFKKYRPLFGSYYASKVGRTEIIAHGTTIDPEYYKTFSYYPYPPTAGCLTTKEFWNNQTGFIQTSDQLLLNQAIQNTGTNYGYLIVIDIDDKKEAVSFKDIYDYLK